MHVLRNILYNAHSCGLKNLQEWKARKHAQCVLNELADEGLTGDSARSEFRERMHGRFNKPHHQAFLAYLDHAQFDAGEYALDFLPCS